MCTYRAEDQQAGRFFHSEKRRDIFEIWKCRGEADDSHLPSLKLPQSTITQYNNKYKNKYKK